MTIGKLSGQCDFGQKGQSYCNQRGQSCVAKRVKVAWLFHTFPNMEILAELSNIGYGNISFSPDDKEILIASTIKGLIYKLEKCS